jgi:hypothetical protein
MTAPEFNFRDHLNDLIAQAKARPPMTPAELQAQRISFAFGNLPEGSKTSREEVTAADYAKYGNLAAMEARLADAEEMAEAIRGALEWLEGIESRSGVQSSAGDKLRAALEKWRAVK